MFQTAGLFRSCLLSLVMALPAAADTLEEVEQKLIESYQKLKSYSARSKAVQDYQFGEGNGIKSESEGTIEWMRQDDKFLLRSEGKTSAVQTMAGQQNKSEQKALTISDGQFLYTLMEQGGEKTAYKRKAEPSMIGDARSLLEGLRAEHVIKVLSDETVDGQACYVIEATPRESQAGMASTQMLYFRKDVGINIKTVVLDQNKKAVLVSTLSELKINPDINAERFVFKVPEGVPVTDLNQQP